MQHLISHTRSSFDNKGTMGALFSSPPKWGQGGKWERFYSVYDDVAREQYGRGTSRLVPTRFGATQVHACGSPDNPVLVLFHGIGANSLMFGDWLVSPLSDRFYCVAIDTLGDMGRSVPRDGDPSNVPQKEEEVAEWVKEVFTELDILSKPISVLGYSLGSYIAAVVARKFPTEVDKVVLMAPAGVFAPIRFQWLTRAIFVGMVAKLFGPQSDAAWNAQMSFIESMMVDPVSTKNLKRPELKKATFELGCSPQVGFVPTTFTAEELAAITESTPALLVIGRHETVIDPDAAVEKAREAGVKVKLYENAGHMLYCEHPAEAAIDEVAAFLLGNE